MYVEVVVPLRLDHSFVYRCAPDLYEQIQPGQRVLVPFQKRRLTAFVVNKQLEIPLDLPPEAIVKEILKIVDDFSLITPELLKLSQWISDYYFSPLGEVLKACLPPGLGSRADKTRIAIFLEEGFRETMQKFRLTPNQAAAVDALESSDSPPYLTRIQEQVGVSAATLRTLQKKGIVRLQKVKVPRDPFENFGDLPVTSEPTPTREQEHALKTLRALMEAGTFASTLLHGVTGSGKTEIYLRLIQDALDQQKDCLVLMPEIGLTPRVAQEFRARLGKTVAILHSGLSDGERHDEWWRVRNAEAHVVIGTRSAIFAPLTKLKLIVVDEEHDASYKQQESPRYNGRDLALVRGKMADALVILGSATPAIESFYNAKQGKYSYVALPSRVQARPMPLVKLIDMRSTVATSGRRVLSQELESSIQLRLDRKEQVLILINRRGYCSFVLCRSCGLSIQCKYCSISLAYHQSLKRLLCHYCGHQQILPMRCPSCTSEYLYLLGEGTEKIESLLAKTFPLARISRLDRDAAQLKNARIRILQEFQRQKVDILVGTQMISKGHDFHNVTLVGILSADHSLSLPDFRSAERTFHLLTQMSGRAGRGDLPGEVLIQTYYPEHYCLKLVTLHDYEGFYEKEIRFRRFMHYPPFGYLAGIQVRGRSLNGAVAVADRLGHLLRQFGKDRVRVLGPAQAPLARIKSEHRFQIILKSKSRSVLNEVLKQSLREGVHQGLDFRGVYVDVDPQNLL